MDNKKDNKREELDNIQIALNNLERDVNGLWNKRTD